MLDAFSNLVWSRDHVNYIDQKVFNEIIKLIDKEVRKVCLFIVIKCRNYGKKKKKS